MSNKALQGRGLAPPSAPIFSIFFFAFLPLFSYFRAGVVNDQRRRNECTVAILFYKCKNGRNGIHGCETVAAGGH